MYVIDSEKLEFSKSEVVQTDGEFMVRFAIGHQKIVVTQHQSRLQFVEQRQLIHDVAFVVVFGMRFKISVVRARGIIRQQVEDIQIAVGHANVRLVAIEVFVIDE